MTARILDTIPDFEKFARKAGLESPVIREQLWSDLYRNKHPEVFEAFFAEQSGREGMHALVRELSKIRVRVKEAAEVMSGLINEVEPAVRQTLGLGGSEAGAGAAESGGAAGEEETLAGERVQTSPLHILMVGTFSTNGFAGRLGDEIAVYHCLEWFSGAEPTRVLIAHEDTHAWHQLKLGQKPPEDPAWTAFSEGLAIQVSRRVVADRPEYDYFWYGVPGFEEWLDECRKDEAKLLSRFKESLNTEHATDAFFGGGFVERKWRTGYFLADLLVGKMDRPINELAAMTIEEGRRAIKEAL